MDITGIKIKDGVCEIKYSEADGMKAKAIKDQRNAPHAAFVDSMRVMMAPLAATCGLAPDDADRMALVSMALRCVTTDRKTSETAISVTITVKLGNIATSDKPGKLTVSGLWMSNNAKGDAMPEDLRHKIETVCEEAESYVRGEDAKTE